MKYVGYRLEEISRGVQFRHRQTVVAGPWRGGRNRGLGFSGRRALVRESEKLQKVSAVMVIGKHQCI